MDLKIATVRPEKNVKDGKVFHKPGENVTITAKTSENSLIFLLGIDKSVELLGKGSDIDESRINLELNSQNNKLYPALVVNGSNQKEQRYKEFEKANAFILTNALDGTTNCQKLLDLRSNGNNDLSEYVEDDSDESGLSFSKNKTQTNNKVRTEFPETWIFDHFKADSKGFYSYELPVPDSITSFVVSGFVVHPTKGFGLAKAENVLVFKDFFMKTYLPYSVKINEILKFEITVFNYISIMQSPRQVKVELYNDEKQFLFVDLEKSGERCLETFTDDHLRSKNIFVPSKSGEKIFFLIKPLKVGNVKLKLKATMLKPFRVDEMEKMLLVENEGVIKYGNEVYFKKPENSHDSHNLNLSIVNNEIIKNSISIEASVVGDILGPALHNIDDLM